MADNKKILHELLLIIIILIDIFLLYHYYDEFGIIILISIFVIGLIYIKRKDVAEAVESILLKIKKLPIVKKVFFSIIIFAVIGSVMFYYNKSSENKLVVAISPFYYIDEYGKSGSDINTANELREKIEENKNLGIKVKMLNNPINDAEDAKSQGKKVGAHLVIYGETKSKIGNRGEIKYYILPLVILEETLAMPSFDIKNREKNNLIFSDKKKFSMVTEERITIIESIEENVSSLVYTIGAFEEYKKSNFTSAIAFFKSVKNYENESSILFYIANFYLFNNNLNESLQYFDKAIEIKPILADAWYNKGTAFVHLGKYEEAVAAFDKAIEIKPDFVEARNNRGTALGYWGRYEEAVATFDKAIEIKPKYADAWNNKGVVLSYLRRYEEAIASFDKAIEIKPDFVEARNNRGIAIDERYKEAVTFIAYKFSESDYSKYI